MRVGKLNQHTGKAVDMRELESTAFSLKRKSSVTQKVSRLKPSRRSIAQAWAVASV